MIEVRGLTKRFGPTLAVDDLSFTVAPGRVTGFLGPNGAGKTTTLRALVGLVAPTAGTALVEGRPYRDLADPLRVVGAVLESSGFHPGRSARDHVGVVALQAGIEARRVDEVLAMVGLTDVEARRAGGFSLGMRQRLALAVALLGDPRVLLLDEPANGLDPEGIRWLRELLRYLAGQGRTVLVSSHVLGEVAQTADDVVIIDRGRLVTVGDLATITRQTSAVRVRSPESERLARVLQDAGHRVERRDGGWLTIPGVTPDVVGETAAASGIVLHELTPAGDDLERAFLRLTRHDGGAGEGER